jgi:hypothetical protein
VRGISVVHVSSITVVLQWCYSDVTVVLKWCYSGVIVVLQWCYKLVVLDLKLSLEGIREVMLHAAFVAKALPAGSTDVLGAGRPGTLGAVVCDADLIPVCASAV